MKWGELLILHQEESNDECLWAWNEENYWYYIRNDWIADIYKHEMIGFTDTTSVTIEILIRIMRWQYSPVRLLLLDVLYTSCTTTIVRRKKKYMGRIQWLGLKRYIPVEYLASIVRWRLYLWIPIEDRKPSTLLFRRESVDIYTVVVVKISYVIRIRLFFWETRRHFWISTTKTLYVYIVVVVEISYVIRIRLFRWETRRLFRIRWRLRIVIDFDIDRIRISYTNRISIAYVYRNRFAYTNTNTYAITYTISIAYAYAYAYSYMYAYTHTLMYSYAYVYTQIGEIGVRMHLCTLLCTLWAGP